MKTALCKQLSFHSGFSATERSFSYVCDDTNIKILLHCFLEGEEEEEEEGRLVFLLKGER